MEVAPAMPVYFSCPSEAGWAVTATLNQVALQAKLMPPVTLLAIAMHPAVPILPFKTARSVIFSGNATRASRGCSTSYWFNSIGSKFPLHPCIFILRKTYKHDIPRAPLIQCLDKSKID